MAGHNKWNNIKRKKALVDGQRGKIFQKLVKEIYIAAKNTNGKVEDNPELRMVVDKAKSYNMPKDNIEKAINKATKSDVSDDYMELTYEGYAPHGVAIMINTLTDNKNRTASQVKSTFTKYNGNLGTDGSVAYLFERKGAIYLDDLDEELMLGVLDEGAIDVETDEGVIVYTKPDTLIKVKDYLLKEGVDNILEASVSMIPSTYIELEGAELEAVENLIEALEDLDDVQDVYHNMK